MFMNSLVENFITYVFSPVNFFSKLYRLRDILSNRYKGTDTSTIFKKIIEMNAIREKLSRTRKRF